VNDAMVVPVSVALNARQKLICCTEEMLICHFLASMPQFTNINKKTIHNFH